jgi:hypothetical protein
MRNEPTMTAIQVDTAVCNRLRALGKKGETYNDILKRLLVKTANVDIIEE